MLILAMTSKDAQCAYTLDVSFLVTERLARNDQHQLGDGAMVCSVRSFFGDGDLKNSKQTNSNRALLTKANTRPQGRFVQLVTLQRYRGQFCMSADIFVSTIHCIL